MVKAIVHPGPGGEVWDAVNDPVIEYPDHAVVSTRARSQCGTDLHIQTGNIVTRPPTDRADIATGHEACFYGDNPQTRGWTEISRSASGVEIARGVDKGLDAEH
ncbi:hypothetical protein [Nakamurella leprariae]|uniref:Uncharacterized protein n=1 Tax=Nakamurella leprariae TaxID=2803911 RepID=A0A938Y538_9ACTN|nr:hypothetical protein [Nakamurella leprariae]MBM9465930.1 hypothetical protein [Nakamurella leprariae]